jgi:branched-chain amino acid transport system substrate-binding protein
MVNYIYRGLIVFCLVFLPLSMSGCVPQPIRVGFTAELTGKQSELGINLRNGVQLAAEEINAAGGINGRKIELIIEDDLGTPEGAQKAENKIIDSGVVAVIGHLTSNQTVEGFKVASSRGVLLFSGTASTSVLSRKKDLFFRTDPSNDYFGIQFAHYIHDKRGLSHIAIIYDLDNNTYSEPMAKAFTNVLTAIGGQVTAQISFSGAASPDFSPLIDKMQSTNPEGVFIIASPLNTANIAQVIRLKNWQIPLFTAPWSQGQDLIKNGGNAVEGLEIIIPFDLNSPSPALQAVKARYQARYAQLPAFTAMYGYELMQMLAEALKRTGGNAAGLSDTLVGLKNYQGLESTIQIDEYGDAMRQLFIQRLQNHQFETIETLNPAP